MLVVAVTAPAAAAAAAAAGAADVRLVLVASCLWAKLALIYCYDVSSEHLQVAAEASCYGAEVSKGCHGGSGKLQLQVVIVVAAACLNVCQTQ